MGMLYWERRAASRSGIRDLPLLESEKIEEQFVPYEGLVSDTPDKGQLLVLTNQRVISFIENDGHKEMFLAPLAELKGVSLKGSTRGLKSLFQGFIMILVGILSYFIVGYILDGISIAVALGAAVSFVGILFIARHFVWEEEGSVAFQGASWELRFAYKSNRASYDVYKLINRFFELKQGTNSHGPLEPEEPQKAPWEPLSSNRPADPSGLPADPPRPPSSDLPPDSSYYI